MNTNLETLTKEELINIITTISTKLSTIVAESVDKSKEYNEDPYRRAAYEVGYLSSWVEYLSTVSEDPTIVRFIKK